MPRNRLAHRYARALFSMAAGNQATAKEFLAALEDLSGLFAESEVARVLKSPVMPDDLKMAVLTHVINKTSTVDANKQNLISFCKVLINGSRLPILPEIRGEFLELYDEMVGTVRVHIVSSAALEKAMVQEIRAIVEKTMKKTAAITEEKDPSLLGGFVVNVGNSVVDLSLKSQLEGVARSIVREN